MESGTNYLRGCATQIIDTSVVRKFTSGNSKESRTFEFARIFSNTLNAAFITGRKHPAPFNNPTSMTLANPEFDASGNILAGKEKPRTQRFGAANGGSTARNIQLEVRIRF